MKEDNVGIGIGGQMNIVYIDGKGDYVEGADDRERVKRIIETFI